MIICVEGPSAVGKTTLVAALAASMSGHVVPELETIDAPPRHESAGWSADRSARRWQEARAMAAGTQAVLLDGDPFKGLWYNAVFRKDGWPDPKLTAPLYRERIENGPGRVLRLDTTRLSADSVVVNARQLIARTDPHLETPRAALVEELANWVCLRPWGRES
jgi:hypothetical protein